MQSSYDEFLRRIQSVIPGKRIYTDSLRCLAWGTDAGFYRLVPRIVIRSESESEVSLILSVASGLKLPVTFRAAGTSLSGQAVSTGILVVAGKNWEKYSVRDEGREVTLQPGIVGARVNRILAPYGRKFGPDPASIGSCMVGGIVMNNASGMSCGTHANSDREMISCRIVLADGTVLDTVDKDSREAFRSSHAALLREIEAIRSEVMANEKLRRRIEYKYSIKNVTGLNLLPLVRFEDPFEIIAHLMVGSEGTLGFMSEVTMHTEPVAPFKASAMIYFSDIREAAKAVVAMKPIGVAAAELLDRRSLASVHDETGEGLTAVLTEVQSESEDALAAKVAAVEEALKGFQTFVPVRFTSDLAETARYWSLRAGIFPTVGGMRREGTTCLIEDIAFHIENLPEATADLSDLLDRHGYDDSCIYGHALEGNFHFIINQAFDSREEVERYSRMIKDVAEMVVGKYDGSLKAEHGTGRNMAPFVEYEWGSEAFEVMRRIKRAFDPEGLLNPGVIFNDDPECYIRDFKALPVLSPAPGAPSETIEAYRKINKCIECGFCEVNCVSCGLGLSSRTRIVALREMARLQALGDEHSLEKLSELKRQFHYPGNELCAGDGLCSTSCPMGINVADLTHEIRREEASGVGWDWAADHFSTTKGAIRAVLRLAYLGQAVLGSKGMAATCRGLHRLGVPLWTPAMPRAYRIPAGLDGAAGDAFGAVAEPFKVVYFPSCFNQMMGQPKGSGLRPLPEETAALLHKAGCGIIFPEKKESLCCGTIWESKGMPDAAEKKLRELDEALWEASEHGRWPVLCDQSPCLHRMRKGISRMKLYEPAEFIWEFLRDRLVFKQTDEPVAVHVTCSTRLMGLESTLVSLARLCSSNVLVPEEVGCCGFAGDKGMTHPELNEYALRKLRPQIERAGVRTGYSNSRTCEIGLTTNSGVPYVSIVYLVNGHTAPKH
jgi:FAD/FMN-containing dehydrogenases